MRRGRSFGWVLIALFAALSWGPTPTLAQGTDSEDPPYSVDLDTLDAALDCDAFAHPDTEPVLLVHGTSVTGHEHWDWNYAPFLRASGRDVCIVTYPDRGLGDMQTSAEYVARAVQRIAAEADRPVDMVGHSQGALMPRWAIKYWPSVRAALDDFVLLAGPQHGAALADIAPDDGVLMPAVTFQFAPDSEFITALNDGDETPGTVDYTSIYTLTDELVQPSDPPTAALAADDGDANVVNIATQDLCPNRPVDHLTIGTTDALTMRVVLDALANPGPADVARVAIDPTECAVPDQYVAPDSVATLLAQLPVTLRTGLPDMHLVDHEPPLRAYAVDTEPDRVDPVDEDVAEPGTADIGDQGASAPEPSPPPPEATADPPDAGEASDGVDPGDVDGSPAAPTTTTEPVDDDVVGAAEPGGIRLTARTGAALPILAAAIAGAVAMVLRLGSSHGDD